MKNVVFWDIKTPFILHRRHITSPLQSPASYCYVRFEVFTAVTMKNDNVVPRSPILSILMMEAIHSSDTSFLIRATRRHILEDGILQEDQ
jgi:hypothetical protein